MKYIFNIIDLNDPIATEDYHVKVVYEWLKNEGASKELIDKFIKETKTDDYGYVLNICQEYTDIANEMAYDNGFVDEHDCMIDD